MSIHQVQALKSVIFRRRKMLNFVQNQVLIGKKRLIYWLSGVLESLALSKLLKIMGSESF